MIEEYIFPLFSVSDAGIRCSGTGFFIADIGAFITAKHVVHKGVQMYGVHTLPTGERLIRIVQQIGLHPKADIALGKLGTVRDINNQPIQRELPKAAVYPINLDGIQIGMKVNSFGYPHQTLGNELGDLQTVEFQGVWTNGEVTEQWERAMLFDSKCYNTTMPLLRGHSGGPVFNGKTIIGVNNSGDDTSSIISPLEPVQDLPVELKGKSVLFRDIVQNSGTYRF